jgi:hypothetical protein
MKNLSSKPSDYRYISFGLLTIGTASLYFAFKYDLNKRANFSYLIENFVTPSPDTPLDQLQSIEDKIVYVKGKPSIEINAKDLFFDIDIVNCIYLQRKTETYQSYQTKITVKDSKGNLHTSYETRYKWSETEYRSLSNPKFPDFYKSASYVSSPVKIGNFSIDPYTLYNNIKRPLKNLNPKEFSNFQKYKPYLNDKLYKWFAKDFYFTNSNSSFNSIGDLRISFKYLDLIPENGLSIIGKFSYGSIVPFSVNSKNFSLFFIEDHYETPDNLIISYVNGIRNKFYIITSFFFTIICLGFRFLEYEKLKTNLRAPQDQKSINTNLKISKIFNYHNFLKLFKNNTFILNSLFFSFLIYFLTKFSEINNLNSLGVQNIYSYNQLAHIQLTSEEVASDERYLGNKLED